MNFSIVTYFETWGHFVEKVFINNKMLKSEWLSQIQSLVSWIWSQFCSRIMFPKRWHQFQLIWPIFRIFFPKITKKNGENWKSIKKLLKMSENSKFGNFWAISTCNTSKESIFHIEFNFTQEKYDLFEKNWKNHIFIFFCQNFCWPGVFNRKFFKFVRRNLKTELLCALETFWN